MFSALTSLTQTPKKHLLLFDETQHTAFMAYGIPLLNAGYSVGPISSVQRSILEEKWEETPMPGIFLYPVEVATAAILCFSSGSQDLQKGIVRSYDSWKVSFQLIESILKEHSNLRGIVIGDLPFSLTLFGVMESLSRGITPLLLPNQKLKSLGELCSSEDSLLWMTPFHCSFYIQAFKDQHILPIKSVKYIFVGGAFFSIAQREALQYVFPNAQIYSFYGASETSFISIKSPKDSTNSVGTVCKGVSVDIRDEKNTPRGIHQTGRLWVKSKQRFLFYLNHNENLPVIEDFIGLTDQGFLDDQRRLFFEGRAENFVSIRGHIVDIQRLERWYKTMLGFENLAILPHSDLHRENHLIFFSQNHLSSQEWKNLKTEAMKVHGVQATPRQYIHCPEWPVLNNGKLDRKKLRTFL